MLENNECSEETFFVLSSLAPVLRERVTDVMTSTGKRKTEPGDSRNKK